MSPDLDRTGLPDRTHTRSESYQWKLLEFATDFRDSAWGNFHYPTDDEDPATKEARADLRAALAARIWTLVETRCTKRQNQVLRMTLLDRMTQIEVAKTLGINQSSVTKTLNGNCDYRNGAKRYGGIWKRLRALAANDEEVQRIQGALAELQET